MISFDFIYEILAPYYPPVGRPSVDPASMFKMLLVGYLYGIKSERRSVEEVQLNIAYCWSCGFELGDTIPDHLTFSKTRTRKWKQSDLFQKVFQEIVKRCIAGGLVDGKAMAADGSYLPAKVSRDSWVDVEIEVERSTPNHVLLRGKAIFHQGAKIFSIAWVSTLAPKFAHFPSRVIATLASASLSHTRMGTPNP